MWGWLDGGTGWKSKQTWRTLAEKVHKVNTGWKSKQTWRTQHCYISHNHHYIHVSSSDMLVCAIPIFTATYVGMVVWCSMLWNVLSLFVFFVSQCLHSAIPTFGRYLIEILISCNLYLQTAYTNPIGYLSTHIHNDTMMLITMFSL